MANKEMLINVSEGEECRIALLEDGKLEELYMERTSSTSHVGNIYKGRVTNVEASIQAAFVDFGLGRNGFLHISDLMPTYFGRKGEEIQEAVGRKMARRDRPPIQRCLRRSDEIVVQIIKEGIGTKGPTLSTYLSIPGRILVMMPGMSKFGVSRKIEDDTERRRLRQILDSLKPIDDVGFIIRTAGIGKTKTEIQRDLTYLTRLWQNLEKKRKSGPGPMELYTEGDLVTRTVRDVFSTDIGRIVIDSKDVAKRVKEVIKLSSPRTKNKVELYELPVPLFHEYGIEREIELMYSRHVPLPSGGSLVIDSTEAIVAIDVNSGKFREHADAETTAFKTDMEAADEIPRQLRLRDLGGVIICDFIDLRFERHRRELEKKLHDNLRKDRAKTKVLRMSQFGIIEMTRQRMRPSLKRSIYFDCPHCKGSGLVKTPESMSLDVMRRLAIAVADQRVCRAELTACPDVAFYLLNRKRVQLAELEERTRKRIIIRQDLKLGLDESRLELFDTRDGLVYLDELGMTPFAQQESDSRKRHQPHVAGRRDQQPRRGHAPPSGRGRRPPDSRRDERDSDRERDDERFEFESRDESPDTRELGVDDQHEPPRGPPAPLAASPINRDLSPAVDDDDDLDDDSSGNESRDEAESHVVDVDDPHEPMGEGPRAIDERPYSGGRSNAGRANNGGDDNGPGRRRRRRRGRRGRGRGRADQLQAQNGASDADGIPDSSEHPTEVTTGSTVEPYGSGEVETESIEATFGEGGPTPDSGAEASTEPDAQPEEKNQDAEPAPGGRRRRRRRGGRRHRRRRDEAEGSVKGSAQAPVKDSDDDADRALPEAADELPSEESAPESEAAEPTAEIVEPAKRSSSRGERGGRSRSRGGNSREQSGGSSSRRGTQKSGAPHRTPPPKPRERQPQEPSPVASSDAVPSPAPPAVVVPRTGSTDRHLMHEDHVDTTHREPARKPRSYRDLDAIPDDFD